MALCSPSLVLLSHDCKFRGLLVKTGFSNLPYELGFVNLFFEVVEGGGAVLLSFAFSHLAGYLTTRCLMLYSRAISINTSSKNYIWNSNLDSIMASFNSELRLLFCFWTVFIKCLHCGGFREKNLTREPCASSNLATSTSGRKKTLRSMISGIVQHVFCEPYTVKPCVHPQTWQV